MKIVLLIFLTLGLFGCDKPELIEPMQVSKPVLVETSVSKVNCQTVTLRTYYTYLYGQPHQVIHTREVTGEPCIKIKQPGND
jgi:hypothetical protein